MRSKGSIFCCASLISIAISALVSQSALAQTADQTTPDAAAVQQDSTVPQSGEAADDQQSEIVVTGYRGSLAQSTHAKRDAVGFTDSIFAEDIGKFPDTN